MSNRRENYKKALGISEYPWSSDDEETENTQAMPELHSLRRQHSENDMGRTNTANIPSTSAQTQTESQSQTSARRNNLFLSLNLPRSSSKVDMPLSLISRPPHGYAERTERGGSGGSRPNPTLDVQRILAFRKLNRQLSNYRASRATTNSVYTIPRKALTTDVSTIVQRSRLRPRPAESSRNAPTLNEAVLGDPEPSTSGYSRRQNLDADLNVSSNIEPVNLDQSDDDDVPVTASPAAAVLRNEDNVASEIATDGSNHNVSVVSLEEEIVEIDAEPEPDVSAETNTTNNNVETIEENSHTEEPAANTNALSSETQPQPHGIKRKRESVDEGNEPCSVREFNQSLLRLLECPVCLEWMEPPMSQCRRGHLVCGRCRARLASCPVCRTAFSSVRNRAMEGVAEMLRYPCRHGCGRDLRLRRRGAHEASCASRRYRCVAPTCSDRPPLPHHDLAQHFQNKHLSMVKIGRKHKFSMKVNSEQHDSWVIMALHQLFHLRVDVDIRTWGFVVYVAYIGPKCNASHYTYEVSVLGQHNSRKLVYTRATHCDLECSSLNVSRQDCFHLTLDQALNFLRVKNRHCEPDKFLNFIVEITRCDIEERDDSDS